MLATMVEPQNNGNKKSTNGAKTHRDDSGAVDKQDLGSKKVRMLEM
jgi:hypothetical protein